MKILRIFASFVIFLIGICFFMRDFARLYFIENIASEFLINLSIPSSLLIYTAIIALAMLIYPKKN